MGGEQYHPSNHKAGTIGHNGKSLGKDSGRHHAYRTRAAEQRRERAAVCLVGRECAVLRDVFAGGKRGAAQRSKGFTAEVTVIDFGMHKLRVVSKYDCYPYSDPSGLIIFIDAHTLRTLPWAIL